MLDKLERGGTYYSLSPDAYEALADIDGGDVFRELFYYSHGYWWAAVSDVESSDFFEMWSDDDDYGAYFDATEYIYSTQLTGNL